MQNKTIKSQKKFKHLFTYQENIRIKHHLLASFKKKMKKVFTQNFIHFTE